MNEKMRCQRCQIEWPPEYFVDPIGTLDTCDACKEYIRREAKENSVNDDMVWEAIKEWSNGNDDRRCIFTHGGTGGKWYCLLDDPCDDSFDGAGDTHIAALRNALEAKSQGSPDDE